MNKLEIEVPFEIKYISEWTDFNTDLLKGHSIINKTITGCGFTHYCLTNSIPTILCSPRKFLLENKHEQLPNTYLVINEGEKSLDVDGEFKTPQSSINIINNNKHLDKISENYSNILSIQSELRSYIFNCQVSNIAPKILVTYDSLKHVLEVLGAMISYYSIIVDEFQNIFIDASFKPNTELNFMSTLQDCPNVTYLSATPYIEEYLNELDEFKLLPYYELKWHPDRLQTIKVDMRKTYHLGMDVDKIIQDYINGNFPEKVDENGIVHQSKEVVFYSNSVKFITSTIKRNKLTPDQVNVICADTNKNEKVLKKIGHLRGKAPLKNQPHKMFTFCTRTTYAGADFYSNCALSVIISDCAIDSLSTDIRMDFPQIMGRQRLKENVFRDECIFIYKLSDNEITMEEFEKRSKDKLSKTEQDLRNYRAVLEKEGIHGILNLIEDFRDRVLKHKYGKDYTGINEKTGEPVVNKLVFIAEKRSYELRSNVYKSEIQIYDEFSKIISEISYEDYIKKVDCLEGLKQNFKSPGSFENKMESICLTLLDPSWYGYIHISDLHWLPLNYRNYLNTLGPEKIKALGCREIDIKREINLFKNGDRIKDSFLDLFLVGERYPLKDIKEKIKILYNTLGISKTPKATDILEFFEVKEYMSTDKITKKRINGYEILKIK